MLVAPQGTLLRRLDPMHSAIVRKQPLPVPRRSNAIQLQHRSQEFREFETSRIAANAAMACLRLSAKSTMGIAG